jgi:hypothetical protein
VYLGNELRNREIRVISKWGLSGEFEHPMRILPAECGSPTEFWTDREA